MLVQKVRKHFWVCGQFVGWFVVLRPSDMLVYLRGGSAQTVIRAAILR